MDSPEQPKEIQRMSLSLRIQHIVLLTSMIILSLTGLALKFHDNWFAHFVMQIEGGFEARGIIHRIFAVILILVGIYHSFYVLFSDEGHRDLMKLVPKLKDLKDFFRYWRRNITGSREKIPFGKYSFINKIQYWGVVLGYFIMVTTGALLWFKSISMAILPKWVIDLTIVFHGWEGLIIFIVLFLWHLYNVHLNPDYFPMNNVWLTGKISVKELKEKYPLEYAELFGSDAEVKKNED